VNEVEKEPMAPVNRSSAGKGRDDADLEQRANELGIDLGLLKDNLRLTPLERMRRHDHAVRQILAVRQRLGTDKHLDHPPRTP
jgi:hypothetical protein